MRGIDDPLEILVGAIEPAKGAVRYFAAPISMRIDCIRLGQSALEACGDRNIEAFSDSDTTVRAIAKEMGVSGSCARSGAARGSWELFLMGILTSTWLQPG